MAGGERPAGDGEPRAPADEDRVAPPIFTYADVEALEDAAGRLITKTAWGSIPSTLCVGGRAVTLRAVSPQTPAIRCLADDDLRALYSPTTGHIELFCAGVTLSGTTEAREHAVRVLGHEALHALQYPAFTTDQIDEASRLNRKRDGPEDYAAYISCDVELPAHAVMIALELRDRQPDDFHVAAEETTVWSYFAGRLEGAAASADILSRLVAEAEVMHEALQPPAGTG